MALYEGLSAEDKKVFEEAYSASYKPSREILQECYDEVASGNEIRSVILHGARLKDYPIGKIDGTFTWKIGEKVRAERDEDKIPLNPFTAGVRACPPHPAFFPPVPPLSATSASHAEACTASQHALLPTSHSAPRSTWP